VCITVAFCAVYFYLVIASHPSGSDMTYRTSALSLDSEGASRDPLVSVLVESSHGTGTGDLRAMVGIRRYYPQWG
jgi:hypothetical protein